MKRINFYPAEFSDISIVMYGDAYDGDNKYDRKFKITFRDGNHYLMSRSTRMYFWTGFRSPSVEQCKLFAMALFNEDYDTVQRFRKEIELNGISN